jgi:hypothetical protein
LTETTVNGSVIVQYPDSFRIMTAEELTKAYQSDYNNRWGIVDEESHMVFCIYWNTSNKLLAALVDSKTICKSTEANIRRMMDSREYKLDGFRDLTISGKKCTGFRHRYILQDIRYVSDVVVMKKGNVCYTFYCYTREECEAANRDTLEGILKSIRLA